MNQNPYSPPVHLYEETPDGPRWRGPDYQYRQLNGLLFAHFVVGLISLIGFGILDLVDRFTEPEVASSVAEQEVAQESPFETIVMFATMAILLTFLGWHFLFLMATVRVGANAHAQGKPTPNISPTFAMLAYFIPIINLYKPYQALRQYYRACGAKSGLLLPFFWAMHLIYSALLFTSLTMAICGSIGLEFAVVKWWDEATTDIIFVELPIDAITFVLSHFVLARLAARQAQLAHQLPASSSPPSALNEPPPPRFSSWGGD